MGFRKSAEVEPSPLLLIADLTGINLTEANAVVGGIDAGVVSNADIGAKGFGQLANVMGDIPLGLFLEGVDVGQLARFIEFGGDFVVFDLRTPLEAVNKEGLGKILKIEPSLDQGLVRAINGLPLQIDGVLVAGEESIVTVERLLICQRFAELLDKPLLVPLGSSVTRQELESLCEAGVNGLVLPQGIPTETVVTLRRTAGSLSRTAKRRAKGVALLPQLDSGLPSEVEEEEEP